MGQQILDSMEARFLSTNGNLACKLMAALQGANVGGADSRCATWNISSFSAFIRVANPGDSAGNYFLDLTVNTYPFLKEPIDTLQTLFDIWGGCTASYIQSNSSKSGIKIFPNPASDYLHLESSSEIKSVEIISTTGVSQRRYSELFSKYPVLDIRNLNPGIYFLKTRLYNGGFTSIKIIIDR